MVCAGGVGDRQHELCQLFTHTVSTTRRELVIVCTAIVGAGLGFLWFNTYPAQVFMGDVGSLALGGALGIIAVLLRQEFLLVIMGACSW